MSGWQDIELDADLRQLAERAAIKAGIPVEQWIERAIRQACPAAFQESVAAPAPPTPPPRNGFDRAPQNNGIDQSLAGLIAAARAPHQPAQSWPGEPAPERFGDEFDGQPRLELRRPMPVADDGEPDFASAAPPHGEDAREPWPSFKDRDAPAESEDFSAPLELTQPLRTRRSRKRLMIDAVIALTVFIGVLGAQRYLSMIAGKPGPQDQTALNSTSATVTPPLTPMPAPQDQSAGQTSPPDNTPAPDTPPQDQSAGQTSPPASTPAPDTPPMTADSAPAVTPPSASVAPPTPAPPVAYNQPATTPPQPPAAANTTSQQKPAAPPAVTEPLPQRKVAAAKPPAAPAAVALPTATAAKKPVPGPGDAPQDPAKLAAWLQDRAKTNDPIAEYRLGVLYALGQGVKQDYGQAAQLFQAAANGGVAEAQYNIAVMYGEGMGVPRDPAQAINWYQKAASQGNANAAFNLGVAYSNGSGVQQDTQEAARWFRRAAAAGVVNAQFNLGVLYERGEGVPQSATEAYAWYAAAASHGDQGASQRRDHLASGFSAADLEKAQGRAAELQKTIQTGSTTATIDQKANAAKP